jgi:hypothetical protein
MLTPVTSRAPRFRVLVVVCAALVLAACSSSTGGRPSTPTGRPSAAATGSGCPSGSGYCATFDHDTSGWPTVTSDTVSARYDAGTYLVTAYHLSTVTEPAPVDVRRFAADGSVRITASATPGHFLPPSSLGLGCRLPAAPAHGGYAFLVDDLEATLSVWDATAGDFRQLVRNDAPGALKIHATNRLDAECRHADGHWQFSLTVNGTVVLRATYGGDDPAGGAAGTGVGVAVHGSRAEVHFDDVGVTAL